MPAPSGMTVACHQVAGPLQIWGNTGTTHAVEFLGYTRSGIEIQEQKIFSELKSDNYGGEQGLPSDYQMFGFIHTITCEMARFDPSILAKYERRINAAVAAVTVGMLEQCAGAQFSVLFIGPNFGRRYTQVYVNEPISYAPIGSPASFPRITFTGLSDLANVDLFPWNSSGASPGGWSVTGSTVAFT